tara:strand:- start:15213 stop:16343 length:1131 start_codon:yes stop_codon:yes gene_type:complete
MYRTTLWLSVLIALPLAACSKAEDKNDEAKTPVAEVKDEVAKTPTTPPTTPATAPATDEATAKAPAKAAPAKDYLTTAWGMYVNRVPGGASDNAGTPDEERAKAETLRKEGYALYKSKKDADAVVKYEEALNHWANGELYYQYANSLSNIDRLEDSIKAYDIAMQLGYEKPELTLYNTACSYSRLEKAEPAYEYLARAIDRGYNAFKFIEKDPDMKFLRSQPDWKKRIEALVPPEVRLSSDKFVGNLEVMTPRDPELYTLCASGKVHYKSDIANDGSCCGSVSTGTWSVETGDLVVTWKETCSSSATGEKKEMGGGCDYFEGCGEAVCAPETEMGTYVLVQREELAKMKNKKNLDSAYDGEAMLTKFAGSEPDACK